MIIRIAPAAYISTLAGALLLASPAFAADRFDLHCKHPNGKDGVSLRIDLQNGEWCNTRTGCKNIEKIVSATSGKIILTDERPQRYGDVTDYKEVNRVTGQYYSKYVGPISLSSLQTCEPAPWSGNEQAKPKF